MLALKKALAKVLKGDYVPYMILAYRINPRCKQYCFKTLDETIEYFSRLNYDMELIKYYEYDDTTNKQINSGSFLGGMKNAQSF